MRTEILGVGIDTYTMDAMCQKVEECLLSCDTKNWLVITPNPEMIVEAQKDQAFYNIMLEADYVVPDGIGVVLASKLNKIKIKERVPGCDLVEKSLELAGRHGKSVYLLGAGPGVAQKACENIGVRYPGVVITGCHDGYFDGIEEQLIIEEIQRQKPDLLIVGMSFPKQEKWIAAHKNELPVKISFAVGGTIDVLSGNVRRAPAAFRKFGLEWLYRLIKQPSRFIRMLRLPLFMVMVLKSKILGSRAKEK